VFPFHHCARVAKLNLDGAHILNYQNRTNLCHKYFSEYSHKPLIIKVAVEAVLLVTEIQNTSDCFESNLPCNVFYDDSLASCLVAHT
jgi:hypothetical protein